MTTYLWPADDSRARTVSLIPYAAGLLLPLWPNPETWFSNGATVSPSGVYNNLASTCGFCGAATDSASGAWLAQWTGSLVHLTSGGAQTNYTLPASAFTGVAFVPSFSGQAYAISASGQLYTNSGSGTVPVGPFLNKGCWGLATSGTTLVTMTGSGITSFNITGTGSATSGAVAALPFSTPLCIAANTGNVAVGGYSQVSFPSGITSIGFDPVVSNALFCRPAIGRVELWGGALEQWALTQSLSGIPHPTNVAWNPNGVGALVTDPTSAGSLNALTFSLNTISLTQTTPLTGAGAVTIQSDDITAFVCQSAQNQVTQFILSGGVWASGSVFSIPGATSVISTGVSGAAVGYASGVAFLLNSGGTWAVSSSATLPFQPTSLAVDTSGNVIASGSNAASGYLTAFVGAATGSTISWTGSVNGMLFNQGQVVVADRTNSVFRIYEELLLPLQLQASISPAPSGVTNIACSPYTANSSGGTLFVMGSGALTYGYQFVGPYTIAAVPSGAVSILTSGSWTITNLQIYDKPTAVTFDVSGNVRVATKNNFLYTLAPSGTILSSAGIPTYTSQPQTTTLGISAMVWALNHLWGSSSLNGSLIELV